LFEKFRNPTENRSTKQRLKPKAYTTVKNLTVLLTRSRRC